MLEDAAEAEDATHETFLRLHRQLARLPDSRQAVFWIYRVATNYCLNELRNRKRRAAPADAVPEPAGALGPIPSARSPTATWRARLIAVRPPRSVRWPGCTTSMASSATRWPAILRISERTVTARLSKFASGAKKYLRSNGL